MNILAWWEILIIVKRQMIWFEKSFLYDFLFKSESGFMSLFINDHDGPIRVVLPWEYGLSQESISFERFFQSGKH